jgi:pimeloyl-ACP methyl ester carboxylesterase
MRARDPDREGFVDANGIKIHYEVYGDRWPTLLLMPSWTIVHKRFWKAQIPYLARHFRVVTYDGPGNGRSARPLDPAAYDQPAHTGYALAVLDATGTERAVNVALSMAANWASQLAAEHPSRVLGTVLIAPSVALTDRAPVRPGQPGRRPGRPALDGPLPEVEPSRVPLVAPDPREHWVKYNREYWLEHYDDFLWFFFGQCFPEPRSTKQIEDCVGWGRATVGEVLVAESQGSRTDEETLRGWVQRITSPVLLLHGDDDRISPARRSELLAELTGGELVTLAGSGHLPLARDPVKVNLLIRRFAERFRPAPPAVQRSWPRGQSRRRRALYLCSPIGLGHARRDLAIAAELRRHHPDLEIDWLAQHPVTRVLAEAGERVHPASDWLANESAHIESESGEHDLHAFEALRRMDEILLANFMVFLDVVRQTPYDLVIGDESWEVDHFLHENPEVKSFGYAWLTDFVGYLPLPDSEPREGLVAADYNAEMIEHIARYPRVRDRAIFVGEPDDLVGDRFGPGLPGIRQWTEQHYDFAGYVTGFDPAEVADRAELRDQLGYRPDERVCVVAVGGSGVGEHLLRRVVAGYGEAARRVPGLRMVVVTGPRIDPAGLRPADGLEIRAYVPRLYRHLAASDLAIVQGGLTTCMELTAARRPFVYIPLRDHFEQQFHVAHRLRRHRAGRQLAYDELTPEVLAEVVAAEIGRPVDYRPVPTDGAARAGAMLAELL